MKKTINYAYKINIILILLLGFFLTHKNLEAGEYFGGGGYSINTPVLGLSRRYASTSSYFFQIGGTIKEQDRLVFQYSNINFDQPDRDQLYYNDIEMEVNINSLSGIYSYNFLKGWNLSLFLNGGFSLNKWQSRRKPFFHEDTSGTIDLPDFERGEWSWGGKLGVQLEYAPFDFLTIGAVSNYHLIVASLWPSTKIRLEQISGLQMLESGVFIRFNMTF